MINALKKLIQGDTAFTAFTAETGGIGSAELAASAVTGAKIATGAVSALAIGASAIVAAGLKYKVNTFSLAGDAVGIASAHSVTYSIVTTGKALGMYLTKLTSHANAPIVTQGAAAITISVAQALIGSDICEGVIITIEA